MTTSNDMHKGRVSSVHRTGYKVTSDSKTYFCQVSGRFEYMAFQKKDYPAVGDYVLFRISSSDSGIIERIVERQNVLARLDVGTIQEEQILASNVDIVFICVSLNQDFHLRKIERLLTLTYQDDLEHVLVLTKKDLCEDIPFYRNQLAMISKYHTILEVSAFEEDDVQHIADIIGTKTAVFIGASGVGKSTLINALLQEEHFETNDIRESDAQGRHTTTYRELLPLPSGGAIIDTPGIRIISSYQVDNVEEHFEEIAALGVDCAFRDCTHTHEPNCAVLEALDDGTLESHQYEAFQRVIRFNRFNAAREKQRQLMQNKRKRNG